jgi:hypothetical protein
LAVVAGGDGSGVLKGLGRFTGRFFVNPFTRTAILTFIWAHRHEVLRWGRSLLEHIVRRDLDPAATMRVTRVLYAVAGDDRFRDAKQLRKVTVDDGVVDLEADQRWPQLPALVETVRSVGGVRDVTVNGAPHVSRVIPAQEAAAPPR